MSAEQLIALEAMFSDLSALYPVTRAYTALHHGAEHELLPLLSRLGANLRSLQRSHRLDEATIATVATQILGESARWRDALETLHASPAYQTALRAFADDDQMALRRAIPAVLNGYEAVPPPTSLAFPFTLSTPPRRARTSPFISAAACARQIDRVLTNGVEYHLGAGPWWDSELQPLTCATAAYDLGASVALRKKAGIECLALFATIDDSTLRVFTHVVRGPFSVVLAAEAEDEWWEAYEDNYSTFRSNLRSELELLGHQVETPEC